MYFAYMLNSVSKPAKFYIGFSVDIESVLRVITVGALLQQSTRDHGLLCITKRISQNKKHEIEKEF